jgi:sugar phosphate isomerase/epimerase
VELALTSDTRRTVDTSTLAEAARAAGFRALGMVTGRVAPGDRDALTAAGLRCHELLGLQVRADAEATTTAAERLAGDAHTVGAPWVLTTFEAGLTDDVRALVARCAAILDEVGTGLAVEFSPLGPVATIADGRAAVAAAGTRRAGLVIDSWNFCVGAGTWAELEAVPLEQIAYLQFADAQAPRGGFDLEEAMTRRALPGDGVLELERFVATMHARAWDGVVSMQVLSDDLRALPVADYARVVYDAGARYWF